MENLNGQLMSFQKRVLENTMDTAGNVQEESIRRLEVLCSQIPWISDTGKDFLAEWMSGIQEGNKQFRSSIMDFVDQLERLANQWPPQDSGRSSKEAPFRYQKSRQELARFGSRYQEDEQTPDVLLDIPALNVDELHLAVSHLEARVSLKAEVAKMVKIDVGVQVAMDDVDLDLNGVHAQALLKVRLEQVSAILSHALQTLDNNAELLQELFQPVGRAAGDEVKKVVEEGSGTVIPRKNSAEGGSVRQGVVSDAIQEISSGIDEALKGQAEVQATESRDRTRRD